MTSDVEKVFAAVRSGDIGALGALLAANPSLAAARDQSGVSLILMACYYQQTEMAELLLARVEAPDIFEAAAIERGAARVAALLDENRALANSFSADGFTPLHLASYFGRTEAARTVLERGADPNAVSRNPMALRPIHSAAVSRSSEIVGMLIARGADVNARQQGGFTALHAAAFNGDLPLAEFLVVHGADISIQTDDGKTARDIAAEKEHILVANWLASRSIA